jgi:hypothetical protein
MDLLVRQVAHVHGRQDFHRLPGLPVQVVQHGLRRPQPHALVAAFRIRCSTISIAASSSRPRLCFHHRDGPPGPGLVRLIRRVAFYEISSVILIPIRPNAMDLPWPQ